MDDKLISLERHDGIAYVTLERADKLNAITVPLRNRFLEVLDEVAADRSILCVVLRAHGRAFCAGQDLAERRPIVEGHPIDLGAALREGINRIILAIAALPQPVVAAVQGMAVGAGASLALAADVVVASEDAVFHFSFARLGLAPDSGASWILTRKAGPARAASILLTAEPLPARTASAWGLVTECVPADALEETATRIARSIAAHPPEAVQAAKSLIVSALSSSLADQLDLEARAQTAAGHAPAYREKLMAFFERR